MVHFPSWCQPRATGGDVNNKACKIQPWLRTDLKSSPPTSVILNCSNFRNEPRIVQNHRLRPHCAENALNRHKCCIYTKLLLRAMYTSSSCFIGRQLCWVWAPNIQKIRLHHIEKRITLGRGRTMYWCIRRTIHRVPALRLHDYAIRHLRRK